MKALSANTAQNNLRTGQILILAKEAMPHGSYTPWLKELNISQSKEESSRRVAEMLKGKIVDSTNLQWEPLAEISRKQIPQSIRDAFLPRLLGPTPPKLPEVKAALRAARGKVRPGMPATIDIVAEVEAAVLAHGRDGLIESVSRIGVAAFSRALKPLCRRHQAAICKGTEIVDGGPLQSA